MDFVYIAALVAFFALVAGLAVGCNRLARPPGAKS